jgi:hypothetical protein
VTWGKPTSSQTNVTNIGPILTKGKKAGPREGQDKTNSNLHTSEDPKRAEALSECDKLLEDLDPELVHPL